MIYICGEKLPFVMEHSHAIYSHDRTKNRCIPPAALDLLGRNFVRLCSKSVKCGHHYYRNHIDTLKKFEKRSTGFSGYIVR